MRAGGGNAGIAQEEFGGQRNCLAVFIVMPESATPSFAERGQGGGIIGHGCGFSCFALGILFYHRAQNAGYFCDLFDGIIIQINGNSIILKFHKFPGAARDVTAP